MLKFIKNLLALRKELGVKIKIAQLEKKHTGLELVTEILRVEGLDGIGNQPESNKWGKWYIRIMELCRKYGVDIDPVMTFVS